MNDFFLPLPLSKIEGPHFYTGVGSRDIPKDVYELMKQVAIKLASLGYVLRSGGAKGADSAFEEGCKSVGGTKEIWKAKEATPEAMDMAAQYHGAWHLCDEYAKMLHGRNAFQVLGKDLKTPSDFVICYTHDGCICHAERTIKTGGTGTAISIASEHNIPVFNLQGAWHRQLIEGWLKSK